MTGDKLGEAALLVEMISHHSGYLAVMTGPGSDLKTGLVSLLLDGALLRAPPTG